MPMLFVQRTGFTNISTVIIDIVAQLKLMGFTEVFNQTGNGIPIPADPITGAPEIPGDLRIDVTLEAPASFSLGTQKWRIKFYGRGVQKTITYNDLTKEILEPYTSGPPNFTTLYRSYNPKQYQQGTITYETAPRVLSVFVGSDIQLPNDGSWGFSTDYSTSNATSFKILDAAGHIAPVAWGNLVTPPGTRFPASADLNSRGLFFYSRTEFGDDGLVVPVTGSNPNTWSHRGAPLTYVLSYTARGLFFGIWNSDTPHTGQRFSWCLIQRSVDRTSGAVRGTTSTTSASECPLFCVFGVETSVQTGTPAHSYGIMVAREKNTSSPGPKRVFTRGTAGWEDVEDTPIFINPDKQVSFNEDGNYMVTFISELVSSRYRYPDELDMVGTISADVIGIGQELQFTVYGEAQPRTYIALPANGAYNTGMRLLVLKANPNEP